MGLPWSLSNKESACQYRQHSSTQIWSLGQEDTPGKEMATNSSILAWRMSWNLAGYSPWDHRVGHNLATEQQQQSNLINTHTEGGNGGNIYNILETCLIGREIPFHGILRSIYVTNQGSWPSPVNRNWPEARQEIQTKLYWGPCCNKWDQEQTSFPCLLAP